MMLPDLYISVQQTFLTPPLLFLVANELDIDFVLWKRLFAGFCGGDSPFVCLSTRTALFAKIAASQGQTLCMLLSSDSSNDRTNSYFLNKMPPGIKMYLFTKKFFNLKPKNQDNVLWCHL